MHVQRVVPPSKGNRARWEGLRESERPGSTDEAGELST
jgi:hypothetical protein